MQVFRLVNGGFVDRLIAFDSLPERLVRNIKTRDISGMPRYWAKWMMENGSVRQVFKIQEKMSENRTLQVSKAPIGNEPCFYVLEYKDVNADREKWEEICNYVRRTVETKVRLMDRIEDMAKKMAPDSHAQLEIEPEDIPVIEVPSEAVEATNQDEPIKENEEFLTPNGEVAQAKKRGRPKKVAVEA